VTRVCRPPTAVAARIRSLNDRAVRPAGAFVVYWMTAFRRTAWNHALDRAVELSRDTGRPLVILEALRAGYPWSSARVHRFVMDGMEATARRLARRRPVVYFPYVERQVGEGRGLLEAMAGHAVAIVADDWPGFFHPAMLASAARLGCRVEAVDSCGLLPVREAGKACTTAYSFRRLLQGLLPEHLGSLPSPDPLDRLPRGRAEIPAEILERWRPAGPDLLRGGLPAIPFGRDVPPAEARGGMEEGERRLDRFLASHLARYAEERSAPDADVSSGLSPYLHFGHISPFEVLSRLAELEEWTPDRVTRRPNGGRSGWWGMGAPAEAFLDELVTWRELGLNAAAFLPGYQSCDSLPDWARRTLAEHSADPRPYLYHFDTLDSGRTHDRIWNAAQRQLREQGTIQNYLRMLWGKKILEWSPGPEEAVRTMVELNNRYALDGRDPNSYSGILWCLGRYDRPWGPERPIFGKVRYMSSANTARKFDLTNYLARFGDPDDVE